MRYRAAVGVGEEAHSRPPAALVPMWCVETGKCGDVPDPLVMAHALAECREL